ncbi:MAG: hypothetical protein CMO55_06360 [Verrucomicrobiales bacterium]|nr:hypothetical protein [Verrucomicrobiales bacterium]
MTMLTIRKGLLLLIAVVLSSQGTAQEEILKFSPKNTRDTFVRVQSIFGKAARDGAVPFQISIRNNTGRDRTWTFRFQEGNSSRRLSTVSTYQFEVPNGTEVRHEVTARMAPSFAAYTYRNLTLSVSSPGLESMSRNYSQSTNADFPTLGMSKKLARSSLTRLSDELKKINSSNQTFAHDVDVDALPSDWLGYTCLDAILLDEEDWTLVSQAQRQAILAWVRLGGRLDIFSENASDLSEFGIPLARPSATSETDLSLGSVHLQKWNGSVIPTKFISTYQAIDSRDSYLENQFGKAWDLYKGAKTIAFNPVLIFALLTIFAVLVAPVNLFYFAGKGKRHRLFLTTPIISISACILIVILILFKDGIGGHGSRVVLADFQPSPGEMRAYITQEQFSSTGVMISPGFSTKEELDISPVNLPASPFNPLSSRSRRATQYLFVNDSFDGRFFPSRSEQAFSIRSAVPTRARIELTKQPTGDTAAPPELVSNLPISITNLVYRDETGTLWKTAEALKVASGNTIPLEAAVESETKTWLESQSEGFSDSMKDQILELLLQNERFICFPSGDSSLPLETHKSIRWDDKVVVITGTVSKSKSVNESAPGNE